MSTHTPSRRNLVIVRMGDRSLHPHWIAGPGRNFDLFLSYFGDDPERHRGDGEYFESRKGLKWPAIHDLLQENPELLKRYDVFWLPDDDLMATTDTINRMFDLFRGFALSLAQPALTRDSYYGWPLTLQDSRYYLRFTQFVEVMAPIFDITALESCRATFGESKSGWGLDFVWPKLCGRGRSDSIAIIDATPVKHTRPLGGGERYRNNKQLSPVDDWQQVQTKYGITPGSKTDAKYGVGGGIRLVPTPFWQRLRAALSKKLRDMKHRRRAKNPAA